MKKKRSLFIACLLIFLIISNPSESAFLRKVQSDYGVGHSGTTLTLEELNLMGTSSYQSWIVASRYTYRFGNIEVNYFGVGFFKFYTGSKNSDAIQNSDDQTIIT